MAISPTQLEYNLLLLKRVGWMLLMVGLPFSNVIMSIATIWMGCIVVLEKIYYWKKESPQPWYKKFALPNDYSVWLIVLYLVSVVGLFYTEDMKHGAWDLRMKLPLLVWPLIGAWIRPLSSEHKKQIWGVYLLALILAVFSCIGVYLRLYGPDWNDVRQSSIFISHIRFGLMLALGVAAAWHFGMPKGWVGRLFIFLIVLLFVGFMAAIESLTGVLLIAAVLIWNTLFEMRKWPSVALRRAALLVVFGLPLTVAIYVLKEASIYFEEPGTPIALLPTRSRGGEPYITDIKNVIAVRGDYVYAKIAPLELERAWHRRSGLSTDLILDNGYPIRATLVRYLSAMQLPKDSIGVERLSNDDIQAILKGFTSPEEPHQNGLQRRLEAVFFEFAHYRAGGDPSGHSITQRWEFWRAAKTIIAAQPWCGVGTGDTKVAFAKAYTEMGSTLSPERRLRAHNQYLTQWLTFGVVGLLVLCLVIFVAWNNGKWRFQLWSSFLLIIALSFLTEDTLESQAGVTFLAFFYVWIGHGKKKILKTE